MTRHTFSTFSAKFCAVLLCTFTFIEAAQACLGVSRSIHISSFKSQLGTGGSGGIGLRHKEVVLTFDDGPASSTTPRVLAALRAECTKATFFVVGRMARAYPKLLQKIARSGHTIAHHTQTHKNLRNTSLSNAHREIATGVASVNAALGPYRGRATKLFRYPYLSRSAALDNVLRRQGLLPLSAGVMSQDWKRGSGAGMVNRVMTRLNRQQRGVILLHDIQAKTASYLPVLLRRLKQDGYRVVHLRSGRSKADTSLVASVSSSSKRSSKRRSVRSEVKSERRCFIFCRSDKAEKSKRTASSRKSKVTRVSTYRAASKKKAITKRVAKVSAKRKSKRIAKRGNSGGMRGWLIRQNDVVTAKTEARDAKRKAARKRLGLKAIKNRRPTSKSERKAKSKSAQRRSKAKSKSKSSRRNKKSASKGKARKGFFARIREKRLAKQKGSKKSSGYFPSR